MKIINDSSALSSYLSDSDVRRYFSPALDSEILLVSCEQNEELIRQGEKAEYLFYLLSGRCKVSAIMENGKTVIINNLTAKCLVGEIELINDDVPFSVETLTPAILLALPVSKCRTRLLNSTDFLYHLCADLVEKERKNALKLAHYISFPLENRLARFILDNNNSGLFRIKKTVISESLGVSYRHLQKIMSGFVSKGVLKKDKLIYTITDIDFLQKLADEMEIF